MKKLNSFNIFKNTHILIEPAKTTKASAAPAAQSLEDDIDVTYDTEQQTEEFTADK
jgi:hypothetical protein